jgi:TolA-binding protein
VTIPAIGQPRRRQVEPKAQAARPPPRMPSRKLPVARCQSGAVPLILAMMSPATRNWQLAMLLLLASPLFAAPPSTCGAREEYGKALCAYQRRNFIEAEAAFRTIVDKGEEDAKTVRALYFLARTEMKLGRFEEAAPMLVRIYALDPGFYAAWNCDFLLGECRRALGKD